MFLTTTEVWFCRVSVFFFLCFTRHLVNKEVSLSLSLSHVKEMLEAFCFTKKSRTMKEVVWCENRASRLKDRYNIALAPPTRGILGSCPPPNHCSCPPNENCVPKRGFCPQKSNRLGAIGVHFEALDL